MSCDIDIASLNIDGNEFRSVSLPLRVDGEAITVIGGAAGVANGDLTFNLVQDRKQTSIAISGRNIDAGDVAALTSTAVSAPVDFDIKIVGTGWSPREIAATANGMVTVEVRSGTIADADLQRAGQDLFSLMITSLNPFRKRDLPTRLNCAKAHFDIVDGVVDAERLFGMQTVAIDIVCGGTLNFRSELVDMTCRPEQSEGLDTDRSSLVESLHISGSFLQPALGVNKVGILRQGASLGAGITHLKLPSFPGVKGSSEEPRPCKISLR